MSRSTAKGKKKLPELKTRKDVSPLRAESVRGGLGFVVHNGDNAGTPPGSVAESNKITFK